MTGVRPSWDAVWMRTADAIAQRSRCVRAQVGAVVVDTGNRVIAASYNGPPHSWSDADGDTQCVAWCARGRGESKNDDYADCPSAHAEMNAIARLADPTATPFTLYVSTGCCFHCAKVIANTRIARVVARWDTAYRDPVSVMDFLRACNLAVQDWTEF